jgi:CRISPR-associated protein Cmr2
MSAGIAIAHYLDPLSHVLHEVRRAEDQAKKSYGRNAVVVKFLRHSGEPTTVGCKWLYPGLSANAQPLALFLEAQRLLESKKLSNKCIYTLAEEAATLGKFPLEAQISEIRRLLMRGRKNKEALPDDIADTLARRLVALAEAMNPPEQKAQEPPDDEDEVDEEDQRNGLALWGVGPRRGLVELSGWLLLMAFLQRGGKD